MTMAEVNFERLNPASRDLVNRALREALSAGDNYIGPEHFQRALDRVLPHRLELKGCVKAEIGTLTTPTGLTGRDEAAQIAEYERRIRGVVDRLQSALGRVEEADSSPATNGPFGV